MLKNIRGFSLPELMTAVAVGGIMSLAMASIFTFSAQQFNSLLSQNEAQESLLLASYYLRATLAQGVNVVAKDPNTLLPTDTGHLAGVSLGALDSRRVCTAGVPACVTMQPGGGWTAGGGALGAEPFAVFFRENGGGTAPTSLYAGTGIYFRAPNANANGRLFITLSADAAGIIQAKMSEIYLDNIVAFGIAPGGLDAIPTTNEVKEVNLYIRTRYFKGVTTAKNYDPDPAVATAAGAMFTDLEQTINIGLRNNILGNSTTSTTSGGAPTIERLNNGLYFFRFTAPPVM